MRLDDSRRAVAATSLVRIEQGTAGRAQPTLMPMDRVKNVDQVVGGLLSDSLSPSDQPAECSRGRNPRHGPGGSGLGSAQRVPGGIATGIQCSSQDAHREERSNAMNGLMMDDFPLTLTLAARR
ncbi:MAG: hypothetical protein ABWY97_09770, partial [Thermoleophilaceae bacterium]